MSRKRIEGIKSEKTSVSPIFRWTFIEHFSLGGPNCIFLVPKIFFGESFFEKSFDEMVSSLEPMLFGFPAIFFDSVVKTAFYVSRRKFIKTFFLKTFFVLYYSLTMNKDISESWWTTSPSLAKLHYTCPKRPTDGKQIDEKNFILPTTFGRLLKIFR